MKKKHDDWPADLMKPHEGCPVGKTFSPTFRYLAEGKVIDAVLTERDWNVGSSDARYKAATEELGPLTKDHRYDFQWFIDLERNAAVLAVYRPWKREAVGATR
jgi:hypothetical protein